MVAKPSRPTELTYEEQVAIARANLERHIAEVRAQRDRLLAAGIDPDAELAKLVREAFTWDALWQTYVEFRQNPSDWLDQTGPESDTPGETETDAGAAD